MKAVWLAVYVLCSLGLAIYGANALFLVWRFSRVKETRHPAEASCRPTVTVQLPLYNELNVADRLLHAVLALRYPPDRLVIQVLDDSTDGTSRLVRETLAADLLPGTVVERRFVGALVVEGDLPDGRRVQLVHRSDRQGYKAGALARGMDLSRTELYAILDADFVPGPDFLLQAVGHFADRAVGFVQARWGHVNREESILTRAQALAIDAHFVVEQQTRYAGGFLFNFNGTAGLWRGAAVRDAGGWTSDTLTEDLDLSYRVQLAGWRGVFCSDLVVPAELPRDINAYKAQQSRWAKGSIQTARKLLPSVLRAPLRAGVKAQATVHLLGYVVHPLLAGLLVGSAALLRSFSPPATAAGSLLLLGAGIVSLGPPLLVATAQRQLSPGWGRRCLGLLPLTILGIGMAVNNSRAVAEGLLGVPSGFERTPKLGTGAHRADYRALPGLSPLVETGAAGLALWALATAVGNGRYSPVPFLAVYLGAFASVAFLSLASLRRSRGSAANAGTYETTTAQPRSPKGVPTYEA